jgi:hypothetical protein
MTPMAHRARTCRARNEPRHIHARNVPQSWYDLVIHSTENHMVRWLRSPTYRPREGGYVRVRVCMCACVCVCVCVRV